MLTENNLHNYQIKGRKAILTCENCGTHEHRVLAEKILGRPLKKGEIVHHKDGNIRNNSLDNLEVISSQSEHFSLHLKGNKYARKK